MSSTCNSTGVGIFSGTGHHPTAPSQYEVTVRDGSTAGSKIVSFTRGSIAFEMEWPSAELASFITDLGGTP